MRGSMPVLAKPGWRRLPPCQTVEVLLQHCGGERIPPRIHVHFAVAWKEVQSRLRLHGRQHVDEINPCLPEARLDVLEVIPLDGERVAADDLRQEVRLHLEVHGDHQQQETCTAELRLSFHTLDEPEKLALACVQ